MEIISVRTSARDDLVDLTARVQAVVKKSGVKTGLVHVFIPHTTAGVTVNENADPSVPRDILHALDRAIPWEGGYAHGEGNSAAHVKASLVGNQTTVFIEGGALALGTWQGIFLCEFDGPRDRKVWVKTVRDGGAGA